MCGIVGYVGPRAALGVVLEGLRRMEYRGYDSAGIAIVGDQPDAEQGGGAPPGPPPPPLCAAHKGRRAADPPRTPRTSACTSPRRPARSRTSTPSWPATRCPATGSGSGTPGGPPTAVRPT